MVAALKMVQGGAGWGTRETGGPWTLQKGGRGQGTVRRPTPTSSLQMTHEGSPDAGQQSPVTHLPFWRGKMFPQWRSGPGRAGAEPSHTGPGWEGGHSMAPWGNFLFIRP